MCIIKNKQAAYLLLKQHTLVKMQQLAIDFLKSLC